MGGAPSREQVQVDCPTENRSKREEEPVSDSTGATASAVLECTADLPMSVLTVEGNTR